MYSGALLFSIMDQNTLNKDTMTQPTSTVTAPTLATVVNPQTARVNFLHTMAQHVTNEVHSGKDLLDTIKSIELKFITTLKSMNQRGAQLLTTLGMSKTELVAIVKTLQTGNMGNLLGLLDTLRSTTMSEIIEVEELLGDVHFNIGDELKKTQP